MADTTNDNDIGSAMYELAGELFPICRSLTGYGVRSTLKRISLDLPGLRICEVPSGTSAFDWVVPPEWNIRDAYVLDPDGKKIIDFHVCNLHVVGYSVPVDTVLSLEELMPRLHSLPDQPDAIPYLTSYYKEDWGFCLSENQRSSLSPGQYRVRIDSTLENGHLTYGELLIPGESEEEIFVSTYVCHPSMANNELSGPVVTTYLAKWLLGLEKRRYSYRIVFIPETIGSIVYLSSNFEVMKERVVAGFNVTCVGDDRAYSFLPSRNGGTLADRVALHVLGHGVKEFVRYSYLDRGSDERQYCSPHVDLPVVSVMRSKYHVYPEYHTSKDDMSLISPAGLSGAYRVLRLCIECLERNEILDVLTKCEPQMGRRGLYPALSTKESTSTMAAMMDILAYADGTKDLIDLANIISRPMWTLLELINELKKHGLLKATCIERET